MKRSLIAILLSLFIAGFSANVSAQMVVTVRAPESETDHRYDYEHELVELLLEKTEDEYGGYEIQQSPVMNFNRAIEELESGDLENLIIKTSATDEFLERFDYMEIPVDRGIFGYRVFFTNPTVEEQLADVTSIEELKEFTIGQGAGWIDVEILNSNGFETVEVSNIESLYKMVAANRFNLFGRGANEILVEYNEYKEVDNFVVDEHVCLYYPLPRFLFTTEGNDELIERLRAGFEKAYQDGSFEELWEEHYLKSIDYVDLGKREIFEADNPLIQSLDMSSLEKYMYDPLGE